ncbi:uncharacterized protein LOC121869309 isoform X2 [Homarus americanus]|uniref:uncharacterized protein LOC121869309 isoform X2 n=1 Tax=Homarus americanus TaxID=6706 RepID=UPI001C477F42|nr:uncharacterized protein LOC121869309 isoform X2 [Homarus americanus]
MCRLPPLPPRPLPGPPTCPTSSLPWRSPQHTSRKFFARKSHPTGLTMTTTTSCSTSHTPNRKTVSCMASQMDTRVTRIRNLTGTSTTDTSTFRTTSVEDSTIKVNSPLDRRRPKIRSTNTPATGGGQVWGQYNGVKDHRDQKPPYQHYQGQKNQSQNSGSQGDSKSRDKETNYGGVYTGGASPSGGIYTGGVYTGDASSPGGVYTGGVYTGGVYTSDIYSGSNDVNYDNTKTPGSKSQWSWDSSHEKETEDNFAFHEGVESTSQGPRFDRSLPRKVTVQAGKTAVLACRVLDSTEKSVSWMRHEDLHILSVGKYKYSTDDRVTVSREEERQEWVLTIEKVTEEDAGMYECQVSAKPVLSFIVSLEVVVPRAEVVHGPEIFVHRGSLINLTCVVTHGTQRPVYVYWYHHNKVLDYEGRGGVTVITKASTNTISHLLMRDARPEDSGVYSCRPSNGEDASATLHVLNGEHQAAMQSDASPRMFTSAFVITFGLCLICVVQLYRSNIDGAP